MRQARLQSPNALHHVFTRGNNKQNIFRETSDRTYFLNLLSFVISKHSWLCHSYCLMGNHYHLLLETPHGGLSEGMHAINGAYTTTFNKKYGNIGHVLQGRYHSPLIVQENHFMELLRYMALNPVKDGFVSHPKDWQWSSYKALAGIEPSPHYLTYDRVLGMFAEEISLARNLYTDFVCERLREAVERSKGRPDLMSIFEYCTSKDCRNAAILKAYLEYRYSMKEIAVYLGMSCSAVSRVISKAGQLKEDWEFRI